MIEGPRGLPPPTGPFAVGETVLEPENIRPPDPRPHPVVHLWYPADPDFLHHGQGPLRRWRDGALRFFRRSGRAAAPELAVAPGTVRFPLLIYFPGWPGTRIENHGLLNELASHGFVVAGIVYPARMPGMPATFDEQVRELEKPMDYSSAAAYHRTVAEARERVRSRAQDAVAVLDALARMDQAGGSNRLSHRLDLDRAGILGFSLGGAVAAEASTIDPRLRAVVNIDGRHWNRALASGVSQPYMFIGEELLQPSDADLAATNPERRYNAILDRFDYAQLARNLKRHGGIQVVVSGTEHLNFTDHALRSRTRRFQGGMRIDPRRAYDIQNAYILAFFKQWLDRQPSPMLKDGAQPFPEARIQVWPP